MTDSSKKETYEIPVILYEEPSSTGANPIPFPYIEVAKDKQMPPVLFIMEYKHTGETEPDERGREAAIVDQIPHKYVDMELLKEKLPADINDVVRVALGMKPLKIAQEEGQAILDKVNNNFKNIQFAAMEDKKRKIAAVEEVINKKKEEKKLS